MRNVGLSCARPYSSITPIPASVSPRGSATFQHSPSPPILRLAFRPCLPLLLLRSPQRDFRRPETLCQDVDFRRGVSSPLIRSSHPTPPSRSTDQRAPKGPVAHVEVCHVNHIPRSPRPTTRRISIPLACILEVPRSREPSTRHDRPGLTLASDPTSVRLIARLWWPWQRARSMAGGVLVLEPAVGFLQLARPRRVAKCTAHGCAWRPAPQYRSGRWQHLGHGFVMGDGASVWDSRRVRAHDMRLLLFEL